MMTRGVEAAILALLMLMAAVASAGAGDDAPPFGFVGAEIQPISLAQAQALGMDAPRGVFVRDLVSWGPAYRAGLRRGDILLNYAGVSVTGLQHLVALVQGSRPGDVTTVVRRRLGQEHNLSLRLGGYPPGWSVRTESTAVLPRLGMTLSALTPKVREQAGIRWGSTGLVVREVAPDSPGAALGLVAGEVLVAADRNRLIDPATAEAALADASLLLVEGRQGFRLLNLDAAAVSLPPPVTAAGVTWQAVPGLGLVVLDIAHRTPGAAAALQPGDLVTKIEGVDATPDADAAMTFAVKPARLTVNSLDDTTFRTVELAREPAMNLGEAAQADAVLGGTVAAVIPSLRDGFALRPGTRGVVVTSVLPDGRAAVAGLRPGMVIVAVNQRFIERPAALAEELSQAMAMNASEAVLVIEGVQGFRIVSLPLKAEPAVKPTPKLLQWGGEAAE